MNSSCSALLLINPHCRQGLVADLDAGVARLREAGIAVEMVTTDDREQIEPEISRRRAGIDFVIVGGGDGTVSSTAPILCRHQLPFAILPLGTANDLARSLSIPASLDKAIDVIIAGERRWIDLGMVNEHYFFNACHIGLGVTITHELTPELKKRWGVLSYLKAFMRAMARSDEFVVELTVDGITSHVRALELTVGNGRYYGGGNVVEQDASIEDGLLSLSCIYPKTVWELLAISPLVRVGKQDKAKRAFSMSGREIRVRTARPMEIDADGEPVSSTPATFKVLAKALQVFSPGTVAGGTATKTTEDGRQ